MLINFVKSCSLKLICCDSFVRHESDCYDCLLICMMHKYLVSAIYLFLCFKQL